MENKALISLEHFTKGCFQCNGRQGRFGLPRNPDTSGLISASGLCLVSEGSGYADRIVSSAVDGIKVAEALVCKYKS